MESYYYVYETENLTNGKKYIGQHCTHDLNDGYYGSQKDLIDDIKNKSHQYKVTILKWCKNIWHLGYEEHEEIKRRNATKNPNYYNKYNPLFVNFIYEFGNSEEAKQKMSLNNAKPNLGKKFSNETREKIRISKLKEKNPMYGKPKIVSEQTKLLMSQNSARYWSGKSTWNKGIKLAWIYKGKKSKQIRSSELNSYLNNGWKKGRGIWKQTRSFAWVFNSNDKKSKQISLSELNSYLNNGWKKGCYTTK